MTTKTNVDNWVVTTYDGIPDVFAELSDWTVYSDNGVGDGIGIDYYDRGTCSVNIPASVLEALGWVRK